MKRLNREQFFGRLAGLDEAGLRKALWNVYWRGSEAVRERMEAEIEPEQRTSGEIARKPVDPEAVLDAVRDFVALARSGSYMGGDRRVSPRERTRWRFTFQRLAADAQAALSEEDFDTAAAAMGELIDFACEMRDYEYFHSDDPVEAARFVVSDAAALLWTRTFDREGFPAFAAQAASQLIRWESRYGWSRGFGRVVELETPLATVIARMLPSPDAWTSFTDHYLRALDAANRRDAEAPKQSWQPMKNVPEQRAASLSLWHSLLLDRLVDSEAEDRLDRLVVHPALAGSELAYLEAKLAHRRGDADRARSLMLKCLEKLPGHRGFLQFAQEIGATLPARARALARTMG